MTCMVDRDVKTFMVNRGVKGRSRRLKLWWQQVRKRPTPSRLDCFRPVRFRCPVKVTLPLPC